MLEEFKVPPPVSICTIIVPFEDGYGLRLTIFFFFLEATTISLLIKI